MFANLMMPKAEQDESDVSLLMEMLHLQMASNCWPKNHCGSQMLKQLEESTKNRNVQKQIKNS